jgi:hypothetical protein
MTFMKRLNAFCLAALVAATPFTSLADAGHDPGASVTTDVAEAGPVRFSAVSETFELVGVLNGKRLTLYLDRADDNSPVKNAQLELEVGGVKLDLKPLGEGEFGATLAQELKVGVTPVAASVVAGQESDLLAADLTIRAPARTVDTTGPLPWKNYGGWAIGVLLALALLAGGWRRLSVNRINRLVGPTQ